MGHGRIPMQLITKEKDRKRTFQKRKSGLIKKVYELSTLCGVDVCMLIYAPNFEGETTPELETWPQDVGEVQRIIKKYYNTTSDRRPKIYDVQEYYKERVKKVEVEISKIRKEILKHKYPTWDDSFNTLRVEQLRNFGSMLDEKLDACYRRMNILNGDTKGKAIAETEQLTPYLTSYPNSHFNLTPQPHFFPPPVRDQNSLAFWHNFQSGQSSQPSMLNFGRDGMTSWVNEAVVDHKIVMKKEDRVENHQNSYYNANTQSYPNTLEAHNLPPGFQISGFYNTDIFQTHMFNSMQERK